MPKLGLPSLSRKKLILIGFFLVLLIGIPITVFLVQQQQVQKSGATKATTLALLPVQKTVSVGDTVGLDVNLDPGVNQVNFVKFVIKYDPTKLKPSDTSFTVNPASNLSILAGPTLDTGSISITLSVGAAFQNAIQSPTKIGSLSFQAQQATDTPTPVTFDETQTQIRSLGSSDTATENVLSSTTPSQITINGTASPTASPTAAPTASPTAAPTASPTAAPTASPTAAPTAAPVTTTNVAPICQSLTLNSANSGTAPYTTTFTATGSDSDGTISKVTFNFGDGTVQDSTDGSGSSSVTTQLNHTYNTAGTFTAQATLTDNAGAVSNSSTCSQTVTISSAIAQAQPTITPTILPSTGPDKTILGVGALGAALSIIGVLLFLAL